MKSEILSLKTIIKKLDFLKKLLNSYYSMKHQKRKMYSQNNKQYNTKQYKIITQEPENFENPNRSVIIKHPKLSHKLSKTIRQV